MTAFASSSAAAVTVLRFATQNPFYAKAVQTPEHLAAVELRDEATARQHQLRAAATPLPPIPTTIEQLDDFIKASADAADHQRRQEQLHTALSAVIGQCDQTIAAAANVFTDDVLTSLAGDMANLMADVDSVADELAGAATAEEAIATNKTKAWGKLAALRADYDSIRAAQQHVMGVQWQNTQSHHLDDLHANLAALRNLDTVFPHWRDADTTRIVISGNAPDPRPWPTDPIRQLIWLSTSSAQPWVPTTAELDTLNAERRDRARHPAGFKPRANPAIVRVR